ncbi:MAG: hypothetical protein ISR48_08695 [Alphaproteobacteria bacterium]|nr:hypothetical protein [Alphaproteobacteria bacterium]
MFFLGQRFLEVDTFLPTAMELAVAHPEWRMRFIVFNEQNYRAILANRMIMKGLESCGGLHFLGGGEGGWGMKIRRRLKGLATIAGWIFRFPRPVLFSSRAFSRGPYLFFSALARLRGGNSYLLWKNRSPDEVHRIIFQVRELPEKEPVSFLARILGRDQDAVIYYHDQQKETLGEAAAFGRIYDVPWVRIGMPHRFPAWRRFIDGQIEAERARLAQEGVPRDAEIYTLFAAKPGSGSNYGLPGSIERSFKTITTSLFRIRPDAVILIRAHPLAMEEPYIKECIEESGRARMTLAHPEVLIALSRRSITNNQTNILFAGFSGRLIDCGEYPEFHFKEHGEVSLAHGYGPLYINPLAKDFESRLARALEDDSLFEVPELTEKRDRLHRDNPPRFEALLNLLEGDAPLPETPAAVQKA